MPATLCALCFALCTVASAQATNADVRFMQDMMGHHAQALVMAGMVPGNTRNGNLRLLAEKIDVSQRDEIATIQRWLRARGQSDSSSHHHEMMPGMLSPAELDQLSAARDSAFDRLFLTLMIRHHEGALTMVARLFATPGAAQDPELAGFANEVDADQRTEIRRMKSLLEHTP